MTDTKNQLSDDRKIELSSVTKPSQVKDRAMEKRKERGRTERFPTGWEKFDDYLGGGFGQYSDGEITVIAAETNVGKSTFAANIAIRLMGSGTKVDYISLEDSYPNVYDTLCEIAGVDDLDDFEDTLMFPKEDLIFGGKAWTSEDLIHHMEQMVEIRGVEVFVLDHLHAMFDSEEQARDQLQRVKAVMRAMSVFATKHRVCILAVAHMNKPGQNQGKKTRPNLDRIYGSGAIAKEAMKVLILDEVRPQPPIHDNERYVDVLLQKQRYGFKRYDWFRFDASTKIWKEKGVLTDDNEQ